MKTNPTTKLKRISESTSEPGAPGSEVGRRANITVPDPQLTALKPRRKYSAKYKLRILQQADNCTESGQLGALLRREGLYAPNLSTWRRQKQKGLLEALSAKKRGRKKQPQNPLAGQAARLEKENQKLRNKFKQAETNIEVQKKISAILGISLDPRD